jgi:hypothetical protein
MFKTRADGCSVDNEYLDEDTGAGIEGTALIADDFNCKQREMMNVVENAGFSESLVDYHQITRSIISLRKNIGEVFTSGIELTPVEVSASRSTDHPSYPLYNPIIPMHDANHDISTAEVPQAVIDVLNAHKFKFGSTTDFTATLAGGVLTFPSSTDVDAMLAALGEMAMVNRWYDSNENAYYGNLGVLWTGARGYCVTIAGVNYAISALNTSARTITLSTYPANGSVMVTIHPYRIAGSTSSSRIRRISGEALVSAGDISGEIAVGGARMHRMVPHYHSFFGNPDTLGLGGGGTLIARLKSSGAGTVSVTTNIAGAPSTDYVNTLTTGKTNDPRTAGMAVYMHLGNLLAKTWTSN